MNSLLQIISNKYTDMNAKQDILGKDIFMKSIEEILFYNALSKKLLLNSSLYRFCSFKLYSTVYYKYSDIRRKLGSEKYTDCFPFKRLRVNPNQVQHVYWKPPRYFGMCLDGDWDKNKTKLKSTVVYKSFENRFDNGADWTETELFKKHKQKLDHGKSVRGHNSERELLNGWYNSIDNTYNNIKQNGYKTQCQLLSEKPNTTLVKNNDGFHPYLNEVGVHIGRNGELIHTRGGLHRLCIARIIGVEKVPALVYIRHKTWQEFRDRIRLGTICEKIVNQYENHPDLQDIIS